MAWFKREGSEEERIRQSVDAAGEKRVKTEGLWIKCDHCRQKSGRRSWRPPHASAPSASTTSASAPARALNCCSTPATSSSTSARSTDPLQFVDTKPYAARLKKARKDTGLNDAIINAVGPAGAAPVMCCAMEYRLHRRQHGRGRGRKIARAIERALERKRR